tara:strand:- start:7271 stop:7669 length:399 start_codon:yes stop_codon:yes gene_type:complete
MTTKNTKAELIEMITLKEEELEKQKGYATHTTPLQVKIADWLTVNRGVEVLPEKVVFTDIGRRGVIYRLEGMTDIASIPTTLENSAELEVPSPHICEYRLARDGDREAFCSCRKSISAKKWAEETGSTLILR